MIDVFVLASATINAPSARVWSAVIDVRQRPSVVSVAPIAGQWPEETATAHVVMDKGGGVLMERTETVILNDPGRRFMIKIAIPGSGITAYLDYQLEHVPNGCHLGLSTLVAAPDSILAAASVDSRSAYVVGTRAALHATLAEYRRALETP